MNGLIIEGLAGTGKTTLMQQLMNSMEFRRNFPSIALWKEDITLGELVRDLLNKNKSDEQRCLPLKNLLPEVKAALERQEFVILERFHHSYFGLMPNWQLVAEVDEELAQLGFATLMLHIPESRIEERCFYRPENESDFPDKLAAWYGSKENAMAAFIGSQRNRLNALKKSRIPTLMIDTSEKQWLLYEQELLSFLLK